MTYTYKELINIYKSRRKLSRAINEKKIYRISRGIYSTEWTSHSLESISKKYPNAIITGLSAFYYYDLTTTIAKKYTLTISYMGSRINDHIVDAYYQQNSTLNIGVVNINGIHIYDKERMLIELFRNKNKLTPDVYREIVNEYREIVNELDAFKLNRYIEKFTYHKTLKRDIYNIIF